MSTLEGDGSGPTSYDIEDVITRLDELEAAVSSPEERREVRRVQRMLERVPGQRRIRKYTSRDVAEGFIGGIVFSLPLLVEDGVFEIAEWFAGVTVGAVPVFFVLNTAFVVGLVTALLYYTDFRDVYVRPIFGVVPRRLLGILVISFLVAAGSMLLWGRLHEEDPTRLEALGRITVIWAAAALGATIGDMLPGESRAEDLQDVIGGFGEDRER